MNTTTADLASPSMEPSMPDIIRCSTYVNVITGLSLLIFFIILITFLLIGVFIEFGEQKVLSRLMKLTTNEERGAEVVRMTMEWERKELEEWKHQETLKVLERSFMGFIEAPFKRWRSPALVDAQA